MSQATLHVPFSTRTRLPNPFLVGERYLVYAQPPDPLAPPEAIGLPLISRECTPRIVGESREIEAEISALDTLAAGFSGDPSPLPGTTNLRRHAKPRSLFEPDRGPRGDAVHGKSWAGFLGGPRFFQLRPVPHFPRHVPYDDAGAGS
jgi:hypothetical protein